MNASRQAAWLFLALAALSFSSWYFASSKKQFKLDKQALSTSVDTIINTLTLKKYDKEGKLINLLKTPLLHHIPLNNQHWLKKPYIQLAQPNQAPWEITADEATSLYSGKEITFNQNVVMHQAKNEKSSESTLTTEKITYFPKNKIATTDKNVTFEQPASRVQSEGMKVYLAEKRVKLLNNVRGLYDPKHQ